MTATLMAEAPIASTSGSNSSSSATQARSIESEARVEQHPASSPSLPDSFANHHLHPSSSNPSLVARAKRKLSRGVIPKFLHPNKTLDERNLVALEHGDENSSSSDVPPSPRTAFTIAPHHHRENTALHALLDSISLPTLPTFSTPHLPFRRTNISEVPASILACVHPDATGLDETEWNTYSTIDESRPMSGATTPMNGVDTASASAKHDDPLKRLKGDVMCLGGYRGSILRDTKTNRRLWVPLKVGMGWRKPDLYIGLNDEDELRSTDTITAGKMLMQIGPINLGKRLKDKLKHLELSTKGTEAELRFHNHGYDWRRNLDLSSAELLEKLETLKQESAARGENDGKGYGTTVMTHSMGGLATLHALARASDPTVFKQIIFAGTPFNGCVNALSPLRVGDGVMFNRDICSPEVCFSMRSTFYFLPRDGRCFETPEGETLPVDFYDPVSFSKYNLSPLVANLYNSSEPHHDEKREEARAEASKADGVGSIPGMKMNLGESDKMPIPMNEAEGEVTLDWDGVAGGSANSSRRGSATVEEGQLHPLAESVPMSPASSLSSITSDRSTTSSPTRSRADSSPTRRRREALKPSWTDLNRVRTSDAELSEYLTRTLDRVKKFYHELETLYDPAKASLYPPVALLTSRKTPTVRGVVADSVDTIRDPYERLLWAEGDGIVLYDSASRMPGQWQNLVKGTIESSNGHVSLLTDLDAVRQSLEVLELDK